MQLDGIELPDLVWGDEFSWSKIEQSAEYSLAGSLIIETGEKLAGRPITLEGTETIGWITRSDLLVLQALAEDPERQMVLTLDDARTFDVVFRHQDRGIEARSVLAYSDPDPDDYYSIIIRLMEV